MRRAGYRLLALSAVFGLSSQFIEASSDPLLLAFMVTFILAIMLLATNFALRLWRGQIQLRPFDALKHFLMLFPIFMALHFLFVWLGWSDKSLAHAVLQSAALAGALAIFNTVYRKPIA